jgi:toluene monooxygenase system ferredoxin subunit
MFHKALARESLWQGEMRPLELGGRRVVLIDVEGEVHAFEDRCAHKGVPISRGRLEDGVLTCWAHQWQYDARTGCGLNPQGVGLRRLPVEVREGDIWVEVEQGEQREREAQGG